jgi:CheY-like chemotaxis protein
MESRGHEVIEACDGQEALDKLEQTSLDLVLLDTSLAITVRAPRFALTMKPYRPA